MNRLYKFLVPALFSIPFLSRSQTVENVKTSFDGERVAITYDLVYSDAKQKFKVSIYSSHDGYQTPLSLLLGAENVYKKGRILQIKWLGGNPNDKVRIQLFNKDNAVVQEIARDEANDQSYAYTIPQNTKAGKDYFVRISNTDRPTELSNSQFFQIKPRTPFIVKVLPVVAVGAGVYFLTKPKTTESDLPGLTINPN
jgi:hypothetical protein